MLLTFTCHLWPSAPTLFSVVWHWELLASKSSQMPFFLLKSGLSLFEALCIMYHTHIEEISWWNSITDSGSELVEFVIVWNLLKMPLGFVLFSMTWQVHTWCDELAIYEGCAWMGSGNHSAEIIVICLREHWCSTARCACIWGLFIYWGVCVSFGFHGMELCLLPHIALD